mmetsp:Transcript_6665/g.23377  ORF Transcript_6665/g.23377 Transcript_6665/m.23377 type:complete len:215 (-) Transcript_6665:441-1085(-)
MATGRGGGGGSGTRAIGGGGGGGGTPDVSTSISASAGASSASSSEGKSMTSTTTKSCQSTDWYATLSASATAFSRRTASSDRRVYSHRCVVRRRAASPSSDCETCSSSSGDGARAFVYASTSAVKYENKTCVGFKKSNCGLRCSRWARPLRNWRPEAAVNCAVSLMTSASTGDTVVGCGSLKVKGRGATVTSTPFNARAVGVAVGAFLTVVVAA